jgi:NitT/TauT family transport system permease protein
MTSATRVSAVVSEPIDDHRVAPFGPEPRPRATRRVRVAAVWERVGPLLGLACFLAVLIGAWHAWVTLDHVSPIVAPRPSQVGADIVGDPGVYLDATLQTLRTAVSGLAVGVTGGLALAIAVWWSPYLGAFLAPTVVFVRCIPVVAVIPVIARLLGYNSMSVITVTALLSFSISYVMAGTGLRAVPAAAPEVVVAFGGGRRHLLRRVALPSSMPALSSALRMAASISVLAALAAEFLIGTDGLGALFVVSRLGYTGIARSWGVAVVASVLSAAVFLSLTRFERAVSRRYSSS